MSVTLSTSRADLRAFFTAKRRSLPADERRALSAKAQEHLMETPAWRNAGVVALYVAVRGETDTEVLLRRAWESGKAVLLPLCDTERPGCMELVPCPGPEHLRPGYCNIPEPICPEPTPTVAPDCIVTPGLAFDRSGFRLGMGGGFYDRLLSRPEYAGALRLGLAYAFQLIDHLPHETWDMPVDAVCTEKGTLWTRPPSP